MRTEPSAANPFAFDRYGYAWEAVARAGAACHLDFGSYDGSVPTSLSESGATRFSIAADPNVEALSRVAGSDLVAAVAISTRGRLPFRARAFDAITMLDVLEHLLDQRSVLRELHRLLSPHGVLVVTVPRRHLFSALDTGNWKFRFPRLHRIAYSRLRGRDAYERRYVRCENGLFGDIEVGKERHEHFSEASLRALLQSCNFRVTGTDGSGFFVRVLTLVGLVPNGPLRRVLRRLQRADARRFASANLFVTAVPDGVGAEVAAR